MQTEQKELRPKQIVDPTIISNLTSVIERTFNEQIQKEIKMPKKTTGNILARTFQNNPKIAKERCKLIRDKVNRLVKIKANHNRKICELQYNYIQKENQSILDHQNVTHTTKGVDESKIHESSMTLLPNYNPRRLHGNIIVWNDLRNDQCKSSYDLLKTIFKSQEKFDDNNTFGNVQNCRIQNPTPPRLIIGEPNHVKRRIIDAPIPDEDVGTQNSNISFNGLKLTYESHNCYRRRISQNAKVETFRFGHYKNSNRRFITKQSKDNFTLPRNNRGQGIRFKAIKKSYAKYSRRLAMHKNVANYREHSCTIEFSQANEISQKAHDDVVSVALNDNRSPNIRDENSYTINRQDERMNAITDMFVNGTYTINRMTVESQLIETCGNPVNSKPYYEEQLKDVNTCEDSLQNTYRSINTIEDSLAKSQSTYSYRNNAREIDKLTSALLYFNTFSLSKENKKDNREINLSVRSDYQLEASSKPSLGAIDPLNVCETMLNSHDSFNEDLNKDMYHEVQSNQISPDVSFTAHKM